MKNASKTHIFSQSKQSPGTAVVKLDALRLASTRRALRLAHCSQTWTDHKLLISGPAFYQQCANFTRKLTFNAHQGGSTGQGSPMIRTSSCSFLCRDLGKRSTACGCCRLRLQGRPPACQRRHLEDTPWRTRAAGRWTT